MSDDDPKDDQISTLEGRLLSLEDYLLRARCWMTAGLLVAGSVIPFGYDGDQDQSVRWSLASIPWDMIMAGPGVSGEGSTGVDEVDAGELILGIGFLAGFLGLFVVVLAMLVIMVAFSAQKGGARLLRFAGILAALGVIGSIVLLCITLMYLASSEPYVDAGWGGVVLFAGMLTYCSLLVSPLRNAWYGRSEA